MSTKFIESLPKLQFSYIPDSNVRHPPIKLDILCPSIDTKEADSSGLGFNNAGGSEYQIPSDSDDIKRQILEIDQVYLGPSWDYTISSTAEKLLEAIENKLKTLVEWNISADPRYNLVDRSKTNGKEDLDKIFLASLLCSSGISNQYLLHYNTDAETRQDDYFLEIISKTQNLKFQPAEDVTLKLIKIAEQRNMSNVKKLQHSIKSLIQQHLRNPQTAKTAKQESRKFGKKAKKYDQMAEKLHDQLEQSWADLKMPTSHAGWLHWRNYWNEQFNKVSGSRTETDSDSVSVSAFPNNQEDLHAVLSKPESDKTLANLSGDSQIKCSFSGQNDGLKVSEMDDNKEDMRLPSLKIDTSIIGTVLENITDSSDSLIESKLFSAKETNIDPLSPSTVASTVVMSSTVNTLEKSPTSSLSKVEIDCDSDSDEGWTKVKAKTKRSKLSNLLTMTEGRASELLRLSPCDTLTTLSSSNITSSTEVMAAESEDKHEDDHRNLDNQPNHTVSILRQVAQVLEGHENIEDSAQGTHYNEDENVQAEVESLMKLHCPPWWSSEHPLRTTDIIGTGFADPRGEIIGSDGKIESEWGVRMPTKTSTW